MKLLIYGGLALILFFIPFVIASNPTDYLAEFNNTGEDCIIKDTFFYFNESGNLTRSVIYSCCISNENCLEIPFDILNTQEYSSKELEEVFKVQYLKELIRNNQLSPNDYSYGEQFNLCNYYGLDVLQEQTTAGMSDLVIENEKYLSKNAAKIFPKIIKSAKYIGLIKDFNPEIFIVSIACTGLNYQLEDAAKQINMCNHFVTELGQDYSYYGEFEDLQNCYNESQNKIKELNDSSVQKGLNYGNKGGECIKGLWRWISDFFNEPEEPHNLTIEQTDYEKLISFKTISLTYSQNNKVEIAEQRLIKKSDEANKNLTLLKNKLSEVEKLKPSCFNIIWTNFIREPDYNISCSELMGSTYEQIQTIESYIKISKYNSAINLINIEYENLNQTEVKLAEELELKRDLDWRAVVLIISLLILIVLIGVILFILVLLKIKELKY